MPDPAGQRSACSKQAPAPGPSLMQDDERVARRLPGAAAASIAPSASIPASSGRGSQPAASMTRPIASRAASGVGQPRRRPQVVLEHAQLAVGAAHQVRPGDVGARTRGHLPRPPSPARTTRRRSMQLGPAAARRDDPALAVDVLEERVQRAEPAGSRPRSSRSHSSASTIRGHRVDVERAAARRRRSARRRAASCVRIRSRSATRVSGPNALEERRVGAARAARGARAPRRAARGRRRWLGSACMGASMRVIPIPAR